MLRDCVVHLSETDDSATAGVLGEEPQRRGERQGVLTAGMLQGARRRRTSCGPGTATPTRACSRRCGR